MGVEKRRQMETERRKPKNLFPFGSSRDETEFLPLAMGLEDHPQPGIRPANRRAIATTLMSKKARIHFSPF